MRTAILITLSSLFVLAQRCGAQSSGLLVGVRANGEYRTYWIASSGTRAGPHVIASGPDLIVPTKSGFLRVCIIRIHGVEDHMGFDEDTLLTQPATSARGRCAARDESPADTAASCHYNTRLGIGFVSESVIAVEQSTASDCGAHSSEETDFHMRTLDNRDIDFVSYLLPSQKEPFRARALASARKELREMGVFDDSNASRGGDRAKISLTDSWTLARGSARWNVRGIAGCSPRTACSEESRDFTVAGYDPPRSLVGPSTPVPEVAALRARVPGFRDAATSPGGDMTVVWTADSLIVFASKDGKPGEDVFRTGFHTDAVVMIQWATGRYVPLWTQQLGHVLSALPAPHSRGTSARVR